MKFFDKLERRFGKYAIPNLMYYIIGIYLVGFVIELFAPDVYTYYLSLDAAKVLHGMETGYVYFAATVKQHYFYGIYIIFLLCNRNCT